MEGSDQREIFQRRRKRFMEQLNGGVAILPGAPVAVRSADVEYPYRQDNDFYYLTGFTEPESIALFAPGSPQGEFVMFVLPRDKERETWTGPRAGVEGAIAEFGADKAYPADQVGALLPNWLQKADSVYYAFGRNEKVNELVLSALRSCQAMRSRTGSGPAALFDPGELLHEARLFKQPDELAAMRRAIAISAEAHARAMSTARDGMVEWELEALIDYTFRSRGAAGPSYPSIIASGPNATILHYVRNDRQMKKGELVLIDAGAEYNFYASDITRTFPIGARFSPPERALYELVLAAQLRGIESIRPGVSIDEVHDAALRVLVDGMRELKLVAGTTDELITAGTYRRYYMHRTSHWLGMDVHDVGLYRIGKEPRRLEPGMVLTVEPGIYIPADDDSAAPEMRGIGIRIEDDVLVTPFGHEVLSQAIPKSVSEVEALTAV
jgi:Xaa-Pro aminopeptidase